MKKKTTKTCGQWVAALPEVGPALTDYGRKVDDMRVRAAAAYAEAMARADEAEAELLRMVQADWTAAEIDAAKVSS